MLLLPNEVDVLSRKFYREGFLKIIKPNEAPPPEIAEGLVTGVSLRSFRMSENPMVCNYMLDLLKKTVKKREREWKYSADETGISIVCSVPHRAGYLGRSLAEELDLSFFQFTEKNGLYELDPDSINFLKKRFAGQGALVVDDVLSTGASSEKVVDALRDYGVKPRYLICVINRQKGGKKRLEEKGVEVICLMTMEALLKALLVRKMEFGVEKPPIINPEEEKVIREELKSLIL